jgi:hypothetical protein
MPVPALITDLSTTAASNSPAGGDSVAPDLDNYLRAHASFIADNYTNKAPKAAPVFTGVTTVAQLGVGTSSVEAQVNVYGTGQTTAAITDAGVTGATVFLQDAASAVGSGGAVTFGAGGGAGKTTPFAAVKGLLGDATANTTGDLAISTRNATGDTALTERMRIAQTGAVSVVGALSTATFSITEGAVISGTYTPTLTNGTNVAASTARVCRYMRVGNVVDVSGHFDLDPTAAAGTQTILAISLPVASNLAAVTDLSGQASANLLAGGVSGVSGQGGDIEGDVTNDRALFYFNASTTNNVTFKFTFSYTVL